MKPAQKEDTSLRTIRAYLKTFRWLTPTNLEDERKRFFRSKTYNPQLSYPKLPLHRLKVYQESLYATGGDESDLIKQRIRTKRIEETKLKVKLFLARESADLSEISQKLYRVYFDKKSLARAMKDAKRNTRFRTQENLDAKGTAYAINEYLKKYKIDKWNVRITDKVDFYFQVRPKRKLITISSSINWDYVGLDSALAHEVDGHVIRAINAHAQKRYFRENFPFYIKTEEGLSCYLSDYLSDGGELTRAHHAIKYLGGLFALAHSFRKTYEFFLDYGFTPDLAFQRTFRLKRGYTDTSQPGCNAREAMYYEGMLEVKDYLEGGGDIRKLYAGKVGLQDLELVPIPENQVIPKRVETYLS